MQNQSEETKKTASSSKSGKYLINTIALLIVAALIYWLFIPRIHIDKQIAKIVICKGNLKSIAMTINLYANDHEYQLPPHEKWNDLLTPYLRNTIVFRCPTEKNKDDKICTYILNNNIKKLKPSILPDLVLAFEGPIGWNQTGGPEMMVYRHRDNTKCNVILIDGTVIEVNETEAKKLKWKP